VAAVAFACATSPACGADVDVGGPRTAASAGDAAACGAPGYDSVVLCDAPVAYWAMNGTTGTERDLTGRGHDGAYPNGMPALTPLPNGDAAADFDGATQYLTVASDPSLSITATGDLTWEGWIRPDVLQFPHDGGIGYVDWMGKCERYAPSCEWEARLYDTTNSEGRCNRFAAFVFNPAAGSGSGAYWQPACGVLQAARWYHVVGEYTMHSQPADCPNAAAYPGSINIWVNGVEWSQPGKTPTGCMSEASVAPAANGSALNIGTMAKDTWFQGAIGKVAIYDSLLGQARITAHYQAMTGQLPGGSCASTCTP
jgi:hypothetical protein